jgi:hypothetical protein
MAKFTYRPADSPDDPIYNGRVVVCSHQRKPQDKATPQERFPDLQNLPFDPAVEFLKKLNDD